jgi:hypothetical protein
MLKNDKSTPILFVSQFHQPLICILLAATIVVFTLQEWVDRGVIFGVVLDIGEVFRQSSRRWNGLDHKAYPVKILPAYPIGGRYKRYVPGGGAEITTCA